MCTWTYFTCISCLMYGITCYNPATGCYMIINNVLSPSTVDGGHIMRWTHYDCSAGATKQRSLRYTYMWQWASENARAGHRWETINDDTRRLQNACIDSSRCSSSSNGRDRLLGVNCVKAPSVWTHPGVGLRSIRPTVDGKLLPKYQFCLSFYLMNTYTISGSLKFLYRQSTTAARFAAIWRTQNEIQWRLFMSPAIKKTDIVPIPNCSLSLWSRYTLATYIIQSPHCYNNSFPWNIEKNYSTWARPHNYQLRRKTTLLDECNIM